VTEGTMLCYVMGVFVVERKGTHTGVWYPMLCVHMVRYSLGGGAGRGRLPCSSGLPSLVVF
jgi:hypothetical protein